MFMAPVNVMIRLSARGANLLLVARGKAFIGEGRLLGTGRLFPFEHVLLTPEL